MDFHTIAFFQKFRLAVHLPEWQRLQMKKLRSLLFVSRGDLVR